MMALPGVNGDYVTFNGRTCSGYNDILRIAENPDSVCYEQLAFYLLYSLAWDSQEFRSSTEEELKTYMAAITVLTPSGKLFMDVFPRTSEVFFVERHYKMYGSLMVGNDSIVAPTKGSFLMLGRIPDFPQIQYQVGVALLSYYLKIPFNFDSFIKGGMKGVDIFSRPKF